MSPLKTEKIMNEIRVYTLSFELSVYLKPAGISVITAERSQKPSEWMRGSPMQRQNQTHLKLSNVL